jgi:ankyrin repeat protein
MKWMNDFTTDKSGFTAMHFAAFNGDPAVIKLLFKFGADINKENK